MRVWVNFTYFLFLKEEDDPGSPSPVTFQVFEKDGKYPTSAVLRKTSCSDGQSWHVLTTDKKLVEVTVAPEGLGRGFFTGQ